MVAWLLQPWPLWVACLMLAFLFLYGCLICQEAGDALGVTDHGSIVWDEIIAFALILLFVPFSLSAWIIAFLLFRFFDILKPWPIHLADTHFKNGFGVMFDDLLAVPYVLLVFHGALFLWKSSGF